MGEADVRDPSGSEARTSRGTAVLGLLLVLLLIVFAALQLKHLGHPLIWQDEAETVMFGQRILEFGYPKVHGDGQPGSVVYGMGVPLPLAVDAESDAYIGSLWGQYYFAAIGVLLAESARDLHTRTALLRLPFALIGMLGLWLLFLAAGRAWGDTRGRRLAAGCAYVLALCLSTSLILHLREVRYYALAVALLCGVIFVRARLGAAPASAAARRRHGWVWGAAQTILLTALFNVFYPASIAAVGWLGLEALLAAWPHLAGAAAEPGQPPARRALAGLRVAAPLWVPPLIALLLVAPLAGFFEISLLSRVFTSRWGFGFADYAANLGYLAHFLLRYELLAPVIALEVALGVERWTQRSAAPEVRAAVATAGGRALATSLLRLALVYALIGARNPIFFERYFVPLSPILALILVLDADVLARRLMARPGAAGRGKQLAAVAALGLVLVLAIRHDELRGRVCEISEPYRGPLDFVIPDLIARHADPAALTIATNYEAESFMYYLGARVVGRFHDERPDAVAAERAVRPDVVIPRAAVPKRLAMVRSYLAHGEFVRRSMPVADLPYNNIPELYEGRVLQQTHLFRTEAPRGPGDALIVYERVPAR
jgi:hypothetical protein